MSGVATNDEVLQLIKTTGGLTLKSAAAAAAPDSENQACTANKTDNKLTTITDLLSSRINLLEIAVLDLSNCNLISVSKGFCALENLRVLNLSHNKLAEAPECLDKNLRFIEHLDLSHNSLRAFEREPACRVRLKVLLLNDNDLLNIPEWILYVRCFNLEQFDYSFNEVNRLYASQFNVKSNYRLKKLALQSCYVFERDFEYINGIKTLQWLDVSNERGKRCTNVVKGERIFERPFFAKTLTVLKLNFLTLSILSDNIRCLVNLRELYLKCNNLSWLPDTLTTLSRLEVLDVSENTICCLPGDFQKLSNLKKLIACGNSLAHLPTELAKMPQLFYLDLYQNLLPDFPFDISTFTHLDLEQNYLITTSEFPQPDDYLKKRENLRLTSEFSCRSNSPCRLIESDQTSYSSSSSSFTDNENCENEELERVTQEYFEDSWDGPSVSSNYVRVCTESDDEWTGSEPPLVAMRTKYNWEVNRVKERVSPYFSDAD